MLGWAYSDDMLHDSHRNTEMAALYLDVLMTTYNDVGMALAEYNGGPVNAGFYRAAVIGRRRRRATMCRKCSKSTNVWSGSSRPRPV